MRATVITCDRCGREVPRRYLCELRATFSNADADYESLRLDLCTICADTLLDEVRKEVTPSA